MKVKQYDWVFSVVRMYYES